MFNVGRSSSSPGKSFCPEPVKVQATAAAEAASTKIRVITAVRGFRAMSRMRSFTTCFAPNMVVPQLR